VNLNATTTVVVPTPCAVPDAIVSGVVERVNVPALQLAFPKKPGVALVHWYWTALVGTKGQLAKEAEVAFTLRVQLLKRPFMVHEIVAVEVPLTGVMSGSGEVNVIVDGAAMTLPVMANAAATGRFAVRSAARQNTEPIANAQIASRSAIGAVN
jgi:hypothetical protein